MEEEFYISLPAKSENRSISALLHHALNSIEIGKNAERDIAFEHCYLISPYIKEDRPSLYIKYALKDRDAIARREYNLKLREKEEDANQRHAVQLPVAKVEHLTLNSFEQRLPPGPDQANIFLLLKQTANTIDELEDVIVKDLVLHDFLDDDGLEHPSIVVYYVRLKTSK